MMLFQESLIDKDQTTRRARAGVRPGFEWRCRGPTGCRCSCLRTVRHTGTCHGALPPRHLLVGRARALI